MKKCTPGTLAVLIGLALSSRAYTQENPAPLTFDVASIKLSQPGLPSGGIKPLPNGTGYIAQNIPVKSMISVIYRVPARQIVGGPAWLGSENYDVEARADHAYSLDDLHIMFQNLLADRFNLKIHKETREGQVFNLMVAKSGLKMKPNDTGQDLKIPISPGPNNSFVGEKVPMEYLCFWLGQQLQSDQRPVVDKTGLAGTYDFTLSFLPEFIPSIARDTLPPEMQSLPTIFVAVKEQLGLELRPAKGPVPTLLIDHVERPSPN